MGAGDAITPRMKANINNNNKKKKNSLNVSYGIDEEKEGKKSKERKRRRMIVKKTVGGRRQEARERIREILMRGVPELGEEGGGSLAVEVLFASEALL